MVLGALWQLEKISQSPHAESRVFQHKRACQEQCWIQAADENTFKHGFFRGYGRPELVDPTDVAYASRQRKLPVDEPVRRGRAQDGSQVSFHHALQEIRSRHSIVLFRAHVGLLGAGAVCWRKRCKSVPGRVRHGIKDRQRIPTRKSPKVTVAVPKGRGLSLGCYRPERFPSRSLAENRCCLVRPAQRHLCRLERPAADGRRPSRLARLPSAGDV